MRAPILVVIATRHKGGGAYARMPRNRARSRARGERLPGARSGDPRLWLGQAENGRRGVFCGNTAVATRQVRSQNIRQLFDIVGVPGPTMMSTMSTP
jgi:hypothetical protein